MKLRMKIAAGFPGTLGPLPGLAILLLLATILVPASCRSTCRG